LAKRAVKVYLSKQQIELLDRAAQAVGEDRSRFIVEVLMDYLKDLNLLRECVHNAA